MEQLPTGTAGDPLPVNEEEDDNSSNSSPPSPPPPPPSSDGDLNDEQRLTLIQYQDIVGEESEEESLRILRRHNWSLEIAVQSRFNENEGLPPVYSSQPSVPAAISTQERDSNPTQVDLYRQNTWFGWLTRLISLPLSLGHAGYSFCYHSVSRLLLYLVRIVYPTFGREPSKPVDDVLKFKKEYEEEYGLVHPTFYLGSYSQVLSDAKKELKFIVVYLHSKHHESTADFCRTVLSNPGLTEYINGNMLFWACDVSTNEGYKVSRAMRETTYPFLAIVCLRDSRMTIVWRIEGPMGVDELISVCVQVIDENEASLIAARTERQARSRNQELRNDQDSAYQESLRKDREKEEELKLKRDAERKEEELKQRRENEKLMKAEELTKRREECRQRLELLSEPSPTDVGAVQIRINLPSRKLQRYFLTSDNLQVLYDLVLSCDESPSQFILNSNFPKKTYPAETCGSLTLQDLGIQKPTVFFVHDTHEGSSSDEE